MRTFCGGPLAETSGWSSVAAKTSLAACVLGSPLVAHWYLSAAAPNDLSCPLPDASQVPDSNEASNSASRPCSMSQSEHAPANKSTGLSPLADLSMQADTPVSRQRAVTVAEESLDVFEADAPVSRRRLTSVSAELRTASEGHGGGLSARTRIASMSSPDVSDEADTPVPRRRSVTAAEESLNSFEADAPVLRRRLLTVAVPSDSFPQAEIPEEVASPTSRWRKVLLGDQSPVSRAEVPEEIASPTSRWRKVAFVEQSLVPPAEVPEEVASPTSRWRKVNAAELSLDTFEDGAPVPRCRLATVAADLRPRSGSQSDQQTIAEEIASPTTRWRSVPAAGESSAALQVGAPVPRGSLPAAEESLDMTGVVAADLADLQEARGPAAPVPGEALLGVPEHGYAEAVVPSPDAVNSSSSVTETQEELPWRKNTPLPHELDARKSAGAIESKEALEAVGGKPACSLPMLAITRERVSSGSLVQAFTSGFKAEGSAAQEEQAASRIEIVQASQPSDAEKASLEGLGGDLHVDSCTDSSLDFHSSDAEFFDSDELCEDAELCEADEGAGGSSAVDSSNGGRGRRRKDTATFEETELQAKLRRQKELADAGGFERKPSVDDSPLRERLREDAKRRVAKRKSVMHFNPGLGASRIELRLEELKKRGEAGEIDRPKLRKMETRLAIMLERQKAKELLGESALTTPQSKSKETGAGFCLDTTLASAPVNRRKADVVAQIDPKLAARLARQQEKELTGESAVSPHLEESGASKSGLLGSNQVDPKLAARLARQKEKELTGESDVSVVAQHIVVGGGQVEDPKLAARLARQKEKELTGESAVDMLKRQEVTAGVRMDTQLAAKLASQQERAETLGTSPSNKART